MVWELNKQCFLHTDSFSIKGEVVGSLTAMRPTRTICEKWGLLLPYATMNVDFCQLIFFRTMLYGTSQVRLMRRPAKQGKTQ